tara:strand:+ start:1044 stop:1562 length:519 start_codon:yes stop_codon:yes gene_type:complete
MLGLPMVALSWVIFSWIFLSGEIDCQDKRDAIKTQVKKLKTLSSLDGNRGKRYLYDKWVWFGSGFYGLAGIWALIVIEVGELVGFLSNLGSFSGLGEISIVSLIIEFLINQLGNLLQAFLWWGYWPADSMLVWLGVAYLGYWIGVELARHAQFESMEQLVSLLRSKFNSPPK